MSSGPTSSTLVPRIPLLLGVGLVGLPAAFLVVANADWLSWALLVEALLVVGAVFDAVLVWGRLGGIRIEIPARIRAVQGRVTSFALKLRQDREGPIQLRISLAWPREVEGAELDQVVRLSGGRQAVEVPFECTPRRRGEFLIQSVRLGIASPWHLWDYRVDQSVQTKVCAYPDLRRDRNALAALFLNRGHAGLRAQRQLGKGRDFEKLREYVPGDGFDEIHWKATAKRGHPVTKVFQVERTQEVYVIIDTSRLSGCLVPSSVRDAHGKAQVEEPILEGMLSAALLLGQVAERQGDLFGLAVFGDRVERFVRARNGKAHYQSCRDALLAQAVREVSPDFDELGTFLRLRLRRRALLLYLTVLEDPLIGDSFVKHAQLVSRQHLMVVSMPRSPGLHPLFSDSSVATVDQVYDQLGGHLRWVDWRTHATRLERMGVKVNLVDTGRLAVDLVENYLSVKRRQSL